MTDYNISKILKIKINSFHIYYIYLAKTKNYTKKQAAKTNEKYHTVHYLILSAVR